MKEETEKNKAGVKTKCVARRLINGKSKKVGENCNASKKTEEQMDIDENSEHDEKAEPVKESNIIILTNQLVRYINQEPGEFFVENFKKTISSRKMFSNCSNQIMSKQRNCISNVENVIVKEFQK